MKRQMHNINSAMIMAAGLGTRLRPVTDYFPKPMISVNKTTLIDYALQKLYKAGVTSVVINLHAHSSMLRDHVNSLDVTKHFKVTFAEETILLDAGGLLQVLPFFNEQPFYVLNSDNIWLDDHERLLDNLRLNWRDNMRMLLSLVPKKLAKGHDGNGDFNLNEDGQIIYNESKDHDYIFMGPRIITKSLFGNLHVTKFQLFKDFIIPEYLKENGIVDYVYGMVHKELWFDAGNHEGLRVVKDYFEHNCRVLKI